MAEELGIRTVIVPRFAGALVGIGHVAGRSRARLLSRRLDPLADREYDSRSSNALARRDMPGAKLERIADVRYVGQSYELTIPLGWLV